MNSWQNGGAKSRPLTGRSGEIVSAENELQRPVATSASLANTPQGDESVVERWLMRGRNAIPQYERDEKRAGWMFRKMEAFALRYGERLGILRRDEVLDYLAELTRLGHTEWQVSQALDSICILLAFGCGRTNVRMSEVRESWLIRRAGLSSGADEVANPGVVVRRDGGFEAGTESNLRDGVRSVIDFVEQLNCGDPASGSVGDARSTDLGLENRDSVVDSWDDEAN